MSSNDVDRITNRSIYMKKSSWNLLKATALKEGYDNLGRYIEDKLLQGRL